MRRVVEDPDYKKQAAILIEQYENVASIEEDLKKGPTDLNFNKLCVDPKRSQAQPTQHRHSIDSVIKLSSL